MARWVSMAEMMVGYGVDRDEVVWMVCRGRTVEAA